MFVFLEYARQTHRNNVDVDTPESDYRVAVFIPFLDNFLEQLHNPVFGTSVHINEF